MTNPAFLLPTTSSVELVVTLAKHESHGTYNNQVKKFRVTELPKHLHRGTIVYELIHQAR